MTTSDKPAPARCPGLCSQCRESRRLAMEAGRPWSDLCETCRACPECARSAPWSPLPAQNVEQLVVPAGSVSPELRDAIGRQLAGTITEVHGDGSVRVETGKPAPGIYISPDLAERAKALGIAATVREDLPRGSWRLVTNEDGEVRFTIPHGVPDRMTPFGPYATASEAEEYLRAARATAALDPGARALLWHIAAEVLPGEYCDADVAPDGIAEAARRILDRLEPK